jgi:hypothetical protein
MSDAPFTPTLFLKEGCPFCLKVRLFLLESGQLDQISIREFSPGTPEETEIRGILAPVLDKVTFPAAELSPGQYLADSDGIIAHFAGKAGVEPTQLPTYRSYIDGVFQRVRTLHRENAELKSRLA